MAPNIHSPRCACGSAGSQCNKQRDHCEIEDAVEQKRRGSPACQDQSAAERRPDDSRHIDANAVERYRGREFPARHEVRHNGLEHRHAEGE
jgi:hypothetical protein